MPTTRKYGPQVVLPAGSIAEPTLMIRRKFELKKSQKAIGLKIRALRESRNWTLEYCEERGYSNWRHLQKVESGQKNITLETILNVANLLGVHPAVLFEDV
jgi:hypothetical protein